MHVVAERPRRPARRAYIPPANVRTTTLGELLDGIRTIPANQQRRFGFADSIGASRGTPLWVAGDVSLVHHPAVAIVGTRNVSAAGAKRAQELAADLASLGVVVVSGLAAGVDTHALTAALEAKGRTIAVIGTPIDRAYPAANKRLQERIYERDLLVSQFPPGSPVFPSNFPQRNKTMAALTDATVIIEASDTSGTLHQAAECTRLGRWLFIAESVVKDASLTWPARFLESSTTRVFRTTDDVLHAIEESRGL